MLTTHKYVMLRHCPFFCNFHTYVMLRWGGVGWDVNVHWHFHTYVMLRHCPFFCNFHTYVMLRHCWGVLHCTSTHTWCYATARSSATSTHTWRDATPRHCPFFCNFHTYVMLRWGGVGWDVNVHWHFHTYVMLRHCPFFCNFHTYVMLRHCWGVLLQLPHSTWCYATACSSATSKQTWCYVGVGWGGMCNVPYNCGVHQATVLIRLRASWRKKTLRGLSMEKLNPQVRRPLFLHQNWRFAMAKPWICANCADGKNSAGMFKTLPRTFA